MTLIDPNKPCKVCGAPVATFTNRGHLRQRSYCTTHWAEYLTTYRDQKRGGKADGRKTGRWQELHTLRLIPPVGIRRVLLDTSVQRVTYYERYGQGARRRAWNYRVHKVLNTAPKLLEFYRAAGYQLVEHTSRGHRYILEKAA